MTTAQLPFSSAVIGDDGEAGGERALQIAAALAANFGTKLHVVHALDVPAPDGTGGPLTDIAQHTASMAEAAAQRIQDRAVAFLGDGVAGVQVELGQPHSALIRAARSIGADLILLGPHTKQHFFDLGGTQRAVFSGAHCHIWSQPTEPRPITRILAPCDLSSTSMAALHAARDLALHRGVPINVLHVSQPPALFDPMTQGSADLMVPSYVVDGLHEAIQAQFEEKMEAVDWKGVEHTTEFVVGSTISAIEQARREGDLTVMGTHGHTGLSAAILGGVTHALLKQASGPLLALRPS